jgi:hypothetical protein
MDFDLTEQLQNGLKQQDALSPLLMWSQNAGQNHNIKIANKYSDNLDRVQVLWNVTNKSVLHVAD